MTLFYKNYKMLKLQKLKAIADTTPSSMDTTVPGLLV
jgi:hypothetical protein